MRQRIISIMPADGWFVIFLNTDQTTFADPLVSWALTEDLDEDSPAFRSVEGMSATDGFVDLVESNKNFHSYSKDPDSFNAPAAIAARRVEAESSRRVRLQIREENLQLLQAAVLAGGGAGKATLIQVQSYFLKKRARTPSFDWLIKLLAELKYGHVNHVIVSLQSPAHQETDETNHPNRVNSATADETHSNSSATNEAPEMANSATTDETHSDSSAVTSNHGKS